MAVGFSEGFDSRLGTCAFRGKECGVAGVRWWFELREDMRRLLAQEIEKTTEKQKSFISF